MSKSKKTQIPDNPKMAITSRGIWMMVIGVLVMIAGFLLLMGGGMKDPNVFNYSMFDFRRLVAAPIVIICGIAIEIVAIIKRPRINSEEKK
ncbi:MAG: DUF3098 domain-containing protein [Bacteroidales bacterium]|nr:DUF3098 domain-containing protein [Bacteroidales bacterium]MDY6000769.1 DUF3098 domain-containing protein [Candidatus Cryptobacteroides sp.]